VKKQIDNIIEFNLDQVINIYNELLDYKSISEIDIKKIIFKMKEDFKFSLDIMFDIKENFDDLLLDIEDYSEDKSIELFLIINYLYSLLIDFDKKSAAKIDKNYFNENNEIINVKKYVREKFNVNYQLDKTRNDFFNEISDTKIYKENKLYSLTAPTGIGKTLASFEFANKIKRENNVKKMIYCLPYTSIIDQNYDEFEKVLKFQLKEKYEKNTSEYLIKHHYLEFLELKQDIKNDSSESKEEMNYLNQKLLLESWESQNIITTFVQFLESIISNNNSRLRKFHNIVNSVVILDEIQCIPIKYYYIVGRVLEVLANRFNTYMLLMTATQPDIIKNSKLLIDEKKYNSDKIFDRVILDVRDINEEISIDMFIDKFDEFKEDNCLIVLNTIASSLVVYNALDEMKSNEYILKYLTTNLTPVDRVKRINEIKELIKSKKKVIAVTTQLIEAGVDLSFKYVYRDFAPFDSIVQVSGRCNRNAELIKKGLVKIVNLIDENGNPFNSKIYDLKLLSITKKIFEKNFYSNMDFYELGKKYFNEIRNVAEGESKKIIKAIKELNYSGDNTSIKTFRLINDNSAKKRVVICQNNDIENKIFEMNKLKRKISGNFDSELIKQYDKLKKEIGKYSLDLFSYKLDKSREEGLINEVGNISYINYQDQKKYVYSKDIGFCSDLICEKEASLLL
jgi:CRISPR-associated endonuclease/helicase Cas3